MKEDHFEREHNDTNYFENSLMSMYYDETHNTLFKEIQESFSKHTLIDLGCGGKRNTLRLLFKDLFEDKVNKLTDRERMDRRIMFISNIEKIKNKGFLTPAQYIGVDKYNVETKELNDKIHFVKSDMLEFLRKENELGNKANVIIGGVATDIIYPFDADNDVYRFNLMTEISKILPEKEGYFLESSSDIEFKYNSRSYKPEDFGLEKIIGFKEVLQVYKKS
jgi:hypothetical protein